MVDGVDALHGLLDILLHGHETPGAQCKQEQEEWASDSTLLARELLGELPSARHETSSWQTGRHLHR